MNNNFFAKLITEKKTIIINTLLIVLLICLLSILLNKHLSKKGKNMTVVGKIKYSNFGIMTDMGMEFNLYLVDNKGDIYWLYKASTNAKRELYQLKEGDMIIVKGVVWKAKKKKLKDLKTGKSINSDKFYDSPDYIMKVDSVGEFNLTGKLSKLTYQ